MSQAELTKDASAFLAREKLRLDRMIRYSFFDIISIAINKPNLCIGGAVWKSALHTLLFVLAMIFLVFLSQTQEAFGCYGHLYGTDYSLHVLSLGMCTLDDAPNIGSQHYTGYPISTRMYVLLVFGCVLLLAVIAFYIYTCAQIVHREHKIISEDTDLVIEELDKDKYSLQKASKKKKETFHKFHFNSIYWWYFDIIAYFCNTPNQTHNGIWTLTGIRVLLNLWSFGLLGYFYTTWFSDWTDTQYWMAFLIPQTLSLLIYCAGLLELHVWVQSIRFYVIQDEINVRCKQIVPMVDIRKAFLSAGLARHL